MEETAAKLKKKLARNEKNRRPWNNHFRTGKGIRRV
jgi:hypothetical protein